MIKISHEVPACLLEESQFFNSYDYCLAHLMDENESYRNYFLKAKKLNREIYLDNSLHELGYVYNTDRLLYWIEQLRPSSFFIPDAWEDSTSSIVNAREWSKIKLPDGVEKVAVVQAKSLFEAMTCTQTYQDLGYKRIAFSYGASYYNDLCPHPDKNIGTALGRVMVISSLYNNKILTKYDNVHLLGTACPIEFPLYKGIECIKSIDTSNPIMAAIDGIAYNDLGIHDKPKSNMNTCFNIDYNDINHTLLEHNIKTFRNLLSKQ